MTIIAKIAERVSHRSLLGRVLRVPLRMVPRNMVVPVLGGINRGKRWIAGSGTTNGCWLGTYEEEHFAALRHIIRPGMIAYDIGANAGYYTLALARLVSESGRVFSFEPDARNAWFLRRHLELNQIRNVTFVQAAVSDRVGLVPFTGWTLAESSQYIVPSITLDSFIADGNPTPDFIKMDIEGTEAAALEGASVLLANRQPTWLLATHTEELTVTCKATLARNGYTFAGFDCITDPADSPDFVCLPKSSWEIASALRAPRECP
jgi:FkbM family methyltransferase